MKSLIQRQLNLPAHVIQFCRFLRDHSFKIGPNEEIDLLLAYEQNIPSSFAHQKQLYQAVLVKNRKQQIVFSDLFDQYWTELSKAEDSKTKEEQEQKIQKKKRKDTSQNSLQVLKKWLYSGRVEEEKELATYSAFEAISKKDFSGFLSSEQKELLEIIKIIAKRLANKHSRRYSKSKSQKLIDLKASIKNAMKYGGELNRFIFKAQQKRKVNLILICDVSKSMELYSQFLIEFMYSFQQAVHQIKTFVFSTRLISLSQTLKDGDFEKVLNNLSDQVPYWSGGTRIGESLYDFRKNYGSKLLNKDAIVIILSDGWDTGDIDVLEDSIKYIHKKSNKLIWLNPLAGNPDYQPSTKAMQVCLPYIDIFSSAHNLESLKQVVQHLKRRQYKPKFN